MPLPSSFASAAAGQNANRDARAGRGDGRGGAAGDWARSGGRANGTLTFRRSSTTPGQTSHSATPSDHAFPQTPLEPTTPSVSGVASYDFASQPAQYAKQSILELFQDAASQQESSEVLEPGWAPGHVNGNSSRGWGKASHTHANQDPNSCWLPAASNGPNSSRNLSVEEKEAFASDVNSPLKPPNQQQKDGAQQGGTNGRKTSVSHGSGPGFGVASPTSASRPSTRRRETTDSNPFSTGGISSPATARFNREDSGFLFGRKGAETRDQDLSEEEGGAPPSRGTPQGRGGFGGLMRSNTAGTPIVGTNISSLWGQSNQPQPSSGMGNFGQFALPTPTALGGGARGGSRFANLIPGKEGAEDAGGAKQVETPGSTTDRSWRSRPRTDTDPFGDDSLSGSAALGGAKDTSPPPMPNPATTNMGVFETPVKGSTGDFGMSGLNLGQHGEHDQGPVSPSETNPYRSPPAERGEDHDEGDKRHGAGIGAEQPSNFSTLSRGFPAHPFADGSDRSQTSSAGPKGYPSLSNLTGWPAPNPVGTPDRERQGFPGAAFGNSLFNPMGGELQSPGLSSIGGGVFGPPSAGGIGATGSLGRSKLGSLFPAAMQAQMQGHEQHENLSDSLPDLRQSNPLGAIGRNNFTPHRDTESPMRSGRGVFEDLFPSSADSRAHNVFGTPGEMPGGPLGGGPQSFTPINTSTSDLPSSQQRQMVMPDRMRWVYLDPQGQIQGPFTGLEMNDWYKANFFTPDLRVKKVEDSDFEPLGQLIRRIGNSREPFLVPQIGVPHGPPSANGPFSPATPGGVVPPLSGLFPSFGRTLTAEEQNNLERRKQEEQFAMAQQREVMMRQQAITRIQPGGIQGSLHHHSSAHSLQSQPSFGSIASPIGAPLQQPPTSNMAPGSGYYDGASQQQQQGNGQGPVGAGQDPFREDDMPTMNANHNAQHQGSFFPPQPIGAPGNDNHVRSNLPGTEQLVQDEEGFRERLKEFEDLRAERDAAELKAQADIPQQSIEEDETGSPVEQSSRRKQEAEQQADELQLLSLTQQVQKAQAAAAKSATSGLPMPFPPPIPQSGTPLPAPTAQRVRSGLPEQYSRSQSGTPDTSSATEPPPLAPWAKESTPAERKGPSLKEIQEMEARTAAKAEEAAALARKQALEIEAASLREREKAAAIATGLPTTSTWGSGSPVAATSPWTKPGPVKAAPGLNLTAKQKTLADIQREEEVRKEKARAAVAQSGAVSAAGKRYADLALRTGGGNPPGLAQQGAPGVAMPPPGPGWATVGAGGKVKTPGGVSVVQSPVRSVSTTIIKPVSTPKPVAKPVATSVNVAAGKTDAAMDEFNKWLNRELTRGGIHGVDIDTFAAMLVILPLETSLIADAIYANSKTMNGAHFAEEFVRRKRRADQGIVEKQPTSTCAESKTTASSSGWSEVAKKSGAKEASAAAAEPNMQGAAFKVVSGRKKGAKK
ncbi:hypothetical protein ACHAQH_006709 [Verticillium albo-atrum]